MHKRDVKTRLLWRLASDIMAVFFIYSWSTFEHSAICVSLFSTCVESQVSEQDVDGQVSLRSSLSFSFSVSLSYLSLFLSLSLSEIPKGAIPHLNQSLVWLTLLQLKRVEVTNLLQIQLIKLWTVGPWATEGAQEIQKECIWTCLGPGSSDASDTQVQGKRPPC